MALQISAVKPARSRVHPVTPPVVSLGRLRKIALLGSQHSLEYAPFADPSWELWGHASSRMFYQRPPDRYFDLHRKACWIMAHKQDKYMSWLRRNTVPIYMQEVDPEVPASIRYPRERLFAEFRRYTTSHAAYMIALALSEGVTHLGLFGINYSADSEYATQRGSTEYWLGFAEGRGVQLVFPPRCTLLHDPPEPYGYESHDDQGRLIPSYRPKTMTMQTAAGRQIAQLVHDGQPPPPAAPPPESVTPAMIAQAHRWRARYFPDVAGPA